MSYIGTLTLLSPLETFDLRTRASRKENLVYSPSPHSRSVKSLILIADAKKDDEVCMERFHAARTGNPPFPGHVAPSLSSLSPSCLHERCHVSLAQDLSMQTHTAIVLYNSCLLSMFTYDTVGVLNCRKPGIGALDSFLVAIRSNHR